MSSAEIEITNNTIYKSLVLLIGIFFGIIFFAGISGCIVPPRPYVNPLTANELSNLKIRKVFLEDCHGDCTGEFKQNFDFLQSYIQQRLEHRLGAHFDPSGGSCVFAFDVNNLKFRPNSSTPGFISFALAGKLSCGNKIFSYTIGQNTSSGATSYQNRAQSDSARTADCAEMAVNSLVNLLLLNNLTREVR